MAWFFSLPWLEWIKRIRKFRQVQVLCFRNKVYIYLHCSAEQINVHGFPLTASLPSHPFLQLKEKTSALVLSHAKILFGFSCAPSLHLCIWSKCRTFLSQWVLGKFRIKQRVEYGICATYSISGHCDRESLNSRLQLKESAHRYHLYDF